MPNNDPSTGVGQSDGAAIATDPTPIASTTQPPLAAPSLPRLHRRGDRLYATIVGEDEPRPVRVKLLRPLRGRDGEFAIVDDQHRVLATLAGLHVLAGDDRTLIGQALADTYAEARIERIERVWCQDGNRYLDVITDRGRRLFLVRAPERAFVWQADGSALVRDAAGNRYRLPPPAELDPLSRQRLQVVL